MDKEKNNNGIEKELKEINSQLESISKKMVRVMQLDNKKWKPRK